RRGRSARSSGDRTSEHRGRRLALEEEAERRLDAPVRRRARRIEAGGRPGRDADPVLGRAAGGRVGPGLPPPAAQPTATLIHSAHPVPGYPSRISAFASALVTGPPGTWAVPTVA